MKFILIGNGSYVNVECIKSMMPIPDEAALQHLIDTTDDEKLIVLLGDAFPATAIMTCNGLVTVVREAIDVIYDKINQLYA